MVECFDDVYVKVIKDENGKKWVWNDGQRSYIKTSTYINWDNQEFIWCLYT